MGQFGRIGGFSSERPGVPRRADRATPPHPQRSARTATAGPAPCPRRQGSPCDPPTLRVATEAGGRVEDVLEDVVGGIADVGLRIDHQPGVTRGRQDVLGVQVRAEQQLLRRFPCERTEKLDALPHEPDVDVGATFLGPALARRCPQFAHLPQRPEGLGRRRLHPQLQQEIGDHLVLDQRRLIGEPMPGLAALDHQDRRVIVDILRREQADGARYRPRRAAPWPRPMASSWRAAIFRTTSPNVRLWTGATQAVCPPGWNGSPTQSNSSRRRTSSSTAGTVVSQRVRSRSAAYFARLRGNTGPAAPVDSPAGCRERSATRGNLSTPGLRLVRAGPNVCRR